MTDDKLGDRMKGYESVWRTHLFKGTPAIIRVDGKAFHSYTRSLPANSTNFMAAMHRVAAKLCHSIMGARMAYAQSDEISVLVNPWSRQNSEAWFAGNVQKTASVCASIAAAELTAESAGIFGETRPAYFDARAFTLPAHECNNYFVWRQLDAYRNAVNGAAQERFSHKQLHGVKMDAVRGMLREAGHPFEALPGFIQRGAVISRYGGVSVWCVREETPWFATTPSFVEDMLVTEAT
jgi:tRNA(His) guanylyltransferase